MLSSCISGKPSCCMLTGLSVCGKAGPTQASLITAADPCSSRARFDADTLPPCCNAARTYGTTHVASLCTSNEPVKNASPSRAAMPWCDAGALRARAREQPRGRQGDNRHAFRAAATQGAVHLPQQGCRFSLQSRHTHL